MTDILSRTIVDNYGFREALEAAQEHSFGFADNAFSIDEVVKILPPPRNEQGVTIGHMKINQPERSLGLVSLQQELLSDIKPINPKSDLDHIHVLHTPHWTGEIDWHVDIVEVDGEQVAQAGYKRGRFRIGLNLAGRALISYKDPQGNQFDRQVGPGSLYVIDNSHNPEHRSINQGDLAADPRRILIMTDIVPGSKPQPIVK